MDSFECFLNKVAEDGRDQRDGIVIAKYLLERGPSSAKKPDAA
ncbi:hypothetical protein ACWGS9_15720 [Bradyrhizobium sp. Arg314]